LFRKSWLPQGFEFLSGLPEAERRRRRIVTIQAYVDDTGIDGRSPWFIFSALLGTAEDWAGASDRWRTVLDEPPRIAYFKMDEAASCNGQFYGFSGKNRDYKLIRLARSLQGDYPFIEQTLTTDVAVVTKELKARTLRPADNPYFWAFHHLIGAIGLLLWEVNYDEPFEVIFDENPVLGRRAQAWWPVIRAMAEPRLKAILPIDPRLDDDKRSMPLQAADLMAWMSRSDKNGENPFEWLREHLTGVKKSPRCTDFGMEDIVLMFDKSPMPAELQWKIDAAKEAFEKTFVKGGARHYGPIPPKRKRKR
jgi:uncharacterized protein DUF3800